VRGPRRADGLPSALEAWDEIAERLESKRPALFLDYDGTLTPIVSRPERAVLGDRMRATLRDLADLCPVTVVSGRDLADVRALVGLAGVAYAGSHGFDIEGPGGLRLEHEGGLACLGELAEAERELREHVADLPGAWVERKRFAVAVHFRDVADPDVPRVEIAFGDVRARHPGLRPSRGKKVVELRPDVDWDKGRAVLWLLDALGPNAEGRLPFYLGDDETDEDAFRILASGDGVTVRVGAGPRSPTHARYRLTDTDEVLRFLERVAVYLRGRGGGAG
jgi:alpha,alpha-trehalase